MTQDEFPDETLMAFADGELDAATRARVEARLAVDAALAARLAVFSDTRAALSGLVARDAAGVDLPPGLAAKVQAQIAGAAPPARTPVDNVVALAPRARLPLWTGALAASLALAIGLGAGLMLAPGGPDASGSSAVLAALDVLPAGASDTLADGTMVTVIASFVSAEGAFCREYEVTRPAGLHSVEVACDAGGGWDVQLMLALEGTEGYAPASAPELLDLYYLQSDAGAPLSPEEERAALASRGD